MFYLIGKCLALDDHPEFAAEIISMHHAGSINWKWFVGICSDHLILPAIYVKFNHYGVIEQLPDELAEFLKDVHELNLERNQRIIKQLSHITHTLNQHSIYPIFLKGTAHLLENLYSDKGERMIGDIDLLVPEKDYLQTIAIMKNNGYTTSTPVYFDVKKLKHYPPLVKKGEVTHIEIHRLPVAEVYNSWFNSTLIEKSKQPVLTLRGCFILSADHQVIHNFIHGQLGHKGHRNGVMSFRDLYDLYLLSKRVEINKVLLSIKSKSKAIAYFVFTGKALSLKERLYPTDNLASRILHLKHDLNMSSPLFYHVHRNVVYFTERIFIGYIGQLIKSIYSSSTRKSVINRLKNPQWYKAHFDSYKMFFSPQK